MGTGSSKGTTQVVAAGMEDNNHGSKNTNVELHGECSHKIDNGSDKGNTNTQQAKTVADEAVKTNEQELVTQAVDQQPSSSDSLLTLFSEKYPVIAATLTLTRDYYQGLKDAFDNGNLLSPTALGHAHGLFSVYLKYKKPKNRSALTEFVETLGFSKLAYDAIVDCRKKYPEFTTWDRGKGKDSEDEENEKEQNIAEEGNDLEQKNATEGNVIEQNTLTENKDSDQNAVTREDNKEQENAEKVNKKEQALEEEGNEESESQEDKDKKAALKKAQDITSQLLKAVLNYSDLNDSFCLACDEAGMVLLLIDMIKELQDSIPHHIKYVNAETQQLSKYTVRGRMLSTTISILHNLSKRVPTRRSFAACQAINVLILLLKAEVMIYSTKSLLVLAYLTDEENNHLIMADEGPIKFLTSLLKKSLRMVRHRYFGFSSVELAEGLTQIAVNDNNKKTIVQSGAVPVLVTMLQKAKNDDERLHACNTLWTLAFDEENRKEIISDEFAITELEKLLTTENSELKRAAAGALWECHGKEKHAEEKQQSVNAQEVTDTKHVMISYQWDVQKSMIQLKNQLQAQGYKVWMDIDEMGGSTLESMAKAVENASVVLVGVSQKYKESPNCRSEAEYTYQLHRDIIPLMMDYKYKPTGWLGIIMGSKLWIDFAERHKLDTSAEKLMKELGNRGKIESQETHKAAIVDLVDSSPRTSIKSWTHDDVKNWLKDVDLEERMDPNAVKRLDGWVLLRLQDLRKESPEFFYSSIEKLFKTDSKLDSVFDVLKFTDELDKLES